MRYTLFENRKDELLLVARILLMILFLTFGGMKIADFSTTVTYMTSTGLPAPALATIIAVLMEFVVGIALLLGFYTRPLAILLAFYTFATALIGHPYWNMTGIDQYWGMINFYKNISIVGGLLLLCITGPGRYSLDKR
ncbi:DoxX family protein [Dyella subtropica]|uniref:DoxX family protein n=1 Tax=Dyella subtropica TaxID=2992127 RepID=UPI002251784F|nr:DoxX family protein [Dyella subtropica]